MRKKTLIKIIIICVILFSSAIIVIFLKLNFDEPKVGISRFELYCKTINVDYDDKTYSIDDKQNIHKIAEYVSNIYQNSVPVVDTAESYDIVVDFNNKIKIKISYNENRMYLFEAESDEATYNCKGHAQISDEQIKELINMMERLSA